MKQILLLLLFIVCSVPAFSQEDFDFAFKTSGLTVFSQTVDSVATAAKQKTTVVGAKVDPVIFYDTVTIKEQGLRYMTKQGDKFTIYDPQNPKGAITYNIQFAGWQMGNISPVLKYNLLDSKTGVVFGVILIDVFAPQVYMSTPYRQIDYNSRN